jgi:hypothetical protein
MRAPLEALGSDVPIYKYCCGDTSGTTPIMTADETTLDARIRLAVVTQMNRASAGGVLTSDDLKEGFTFEGARIPLINPQRGIFMPTVMRFFLSIRTVNPVKGPRVGTTTNDRCTSKSRARMR